ncbi:type II secretion system F family protein [Salinarimonas soli]|uniref:Type II secretion system F family protein n=1 Tax=Salinarimonas soli TaxID=1638099 RepID=A0A5B2V980_9HYPH|nr:type II secretion system F family protein [Salinarimonas soli]KAA2234942.1 type II secretion system F family protein [Salinarimonas soli]
MMNALDALLDALFADPALLVAACGGAGLALVGVLVLGMVQNRSALRRRATQGLDPAGRHGAAGADRGKPLERLTTYLETTFAQSDERQSRVLRLQLVQAGFFDQRAPAYYFAARIGGAAALGLGGLALIPLLVGDTTSASLALYAAFVAVVGYVLPSFYVSHRIKARAQEHRVGFPDFMDLMVVCSEAGLSLEASVERIARELVEGYPSLAENLYMVSLEMRAGKSLTESLERFGRRLGIEEATMLATLLQQSAELGTSLTQSLKVYSEEMRNKRLSRAEEKAYALPAKLVVPLTLFIFPVLLITLLLPAVLQVRAAMM